MPVPRVCAGQRGYSLIELMVAVVVGVFLLAGLFTVFQETRHTSTEQTGLTQLQDEERLAMSLITNVVQSARYYPNVVGGSFASALPTDGGNFTVAGQALYGAVAVPATATTPEQDTLTVRFATAPGDNVLNCNGVSNSGPTNPLVYANTFAINAANQLTCIAQSVAAAVPGTPATGGQVMPLVNGVVGMSFQFAVNTMYASSATSPDSLGGGNTAASNGNATSTNNPCPADSYEPTSGMSVNMNGSPVIDDWTNVCAIQVTLTFVNPLYQPPGQPSPTPGQSQYVTFQRVISIMTNSGVNSTEVMTTNGNNTTTTT